MKKHLHSIIAGIILLTTSWPVPVVAAQPYAAQWVAQAETVTLKTGNSQKVWVELKNTGTETWHATGANQVKVGTVRNRDRTSGLWSPSWLGVNRAVAAGVEVPPGAVGRFEFDITAGVTTAGAYREYFGLVAEGVAWFDGLEFYIDVNIVPPIITGEMIGSVTPIVMKVGEVKQVTLSVKNTGDTLWPNSGPNAVKIGTAGPLDRSSLFKSSSWLSNNRVASSTAPVAPGEIGQFNINLTAPAKVGRYVEAFSVVVEGWAWVPNTQWVLDITVQPAIYSAEFVNQSGSVVLTPGEVASVWVELRNRGNTIWQPSGDNPTKLGTARPLDRDSAVRDTSWLSVNRVVTVDRSIAPGEVGRFSFQILAPEKIGSYKEYFRPVVENVTWMEDLGIYFEVVVNEELKLQRPIRVGLSSTANPITVSSSTGMVIRKGDARSLVERIAGGQAVVVTPVSNGYNINIAGEVRLVDDYLRFVPLKNSIISLSNDGVSSTYSQFRGAINVRRSTYSGNVWMVNELELEDYLRGLAEVPDSWPMEARKAQVVAARTFALTRINAPKADIFDIYDDTRDQVYYGFKYETARPGISQAVDATTGLAVLYNGQLALTYYHSDSGGATENVENVWSDGDPRRAIAYLKGVTDPYTRPVTWQATLSQSYVTSRFDAQLAKIGASSETVVDMNIDDRYPSGRIKSVTLVTSTGKRTTMDLTTFDYYTDSNYVKSMNFTIIETGPDNAPDFILSGQGNGHGIGLSQWSAYNMASQGQAYDQILKYFYTGVVVGAA